MPTEDDDLYDGDYEFVDDEELDTDAPEFSADEAEDLDESEIEQEPVAPERPKRGRPKKKAATAKSSGGKKAPKAGGRKRKVAVEASSAEDPPEEELVSANHQAAQADVDEPSDDCRSDNAESVQSKKEAPSEEEAEPAGPLADSVVHIYAMGKFKRTIDRPFTEDEAIAFAECYNKTSKNYGRWAVPGSKEVSPSSELAP